MALVNFKRGNLATYTAATKSADTLYFVTDEHRIYMGEVPYSGGIYKEVAALPATGEINTIYKVTDTSEGSAVNGDVAYWDSTKYVYLVDMSDIHAKANAYADSLNTAMNSRVATLETAVGSGGSVDSKIQEALDGKAAVGHKHAIADVDGLQDYIDSHGVRLVTQVTNGNLTITIV